MGGLVTPQGLQTHSQQQAAVQPQVAAPPAQVVSSGAPSADVIARAKQGALSVLEKINQASLKRTLDCKAQRSTCLKCPRAPF